MWAKAQVSTEIISLLSGADQRSRDIIIRITREKFKHGKATTPKRSRS